jgi:signal transduction histidine kinase
LVWLLVGSFVLTIVSFIAATLVAEHRARGIETAAESITTNALPSIACHSGARTELRQIELLLERLTDTDGTTPRRTVETDKADLRKARANLADYSSTCTRLPTYANEQALADHITARSAAMNVSIDRVIAELEEGDEAAATKELTLRTEPAVDRLDAAMVNAIELNARQSAALGEQIRAMRTSAHDLGTLLLASSAALASIAAFFMVRMLRRFMHLMESRVSDMEHFAGRVAHDIRSPLASVGLALELTKRNPQIGRGVLDRANATLQRIGQLVDGLLVFARSGEVPDEICATNAVEVVTGVVDQMRLTAESCGVEIELEPPAERPLVVACSAGVLISLVSNLVGNAVKHMGNAPVRHVTVRVQDLGRAVRFEVSDTGPGVPAELCERIFDPYVRAGNTGVPGIGLGLATVRRLAEAHHGRTGVLPKPSGSGSTFWFELPKGEREPARKLTIRRWLTSAG